MAANDEFPRGLTQTTSNGSAAATIVFPAAPGIGWVLTSINAGIYTPTAVTAVFYIAVNGVEMPTLFVSVNPALTAGTGTASWTGQLPGTVGAALTVAFSGAGEDQYLQATAYPV